MAGEKNVGMYKWERVDYKKRDSSGVETIKEKLNWCNYIMDSNFQSQTDICKNVTFFSIVRYNFYHQAFISAQ